MPIQPTGLLGKPLDEGRRLVANSAEWQRVTDATDADPVIRADQAKQSTFFEIADDKEDVDKWQDTFPMCIIENDDPAGFTSENNATSSYENSGHIFMAFWYPIEAGLDPRDVRISFLNSIGQIIKDMQLLVTATDPGDYLHVKIFTINEGPWRANDDESVDVGDFSFIKLRCEWGT